MKSTGAEPRSAAFEMLKRTGQGVPLDAVMSAVMPHLDPRDRRLAHEIAAGVLRHRRVIDKTIQNLLTRPDSILPDAVHDTLRIGIYQLGYLNKVPAYAAVSSAVDLARDVGGKKAAGLVNAVLRRFDSTGRKIEISQCSTAERHSHPDWLVARWTKRYGPERTERLLEFFNTRPSLTIQSARWDEGMLVKAFRDSDVRFAPSPGQHGIVIMDHDVSTLPGFAEGAFIVQDSAQRALLDYAAVPEGSTVWDACAAPGGKAVILAEHRTVVASELVPSRAKRLTENRNRVAPTMHIVIADSTHSPFRSGSFDAVVVDAPCSGTGSMARHPDARWSLTEEKIHNSASLQRNLLEETSRAVRPGGLFVYLTCSLEPEENAEQVDGFLDRHAEFERTREDLSIFPPDQGTDGGYVARMRRKN